MKTERGESMKKKAKKILTKYTHIDTGINKKSLLTSCISTCMLYLRWYLWQRKIRRQQFNFFHRQCVFIWARRQSNEKNSEEFCRKRVEIATTLNKWKKEKKWAPGSWFNTNKGRRSGNDLHVVQWKKLRDER